MGEFPAALPRPLVKAELTPETSCATRNVSYSRKMEVGSRLERKPLDSATRMRIPPPTNADLSTRETLSSFILGGAELSSRWHCVLSSRMLGPRVLRHSLLSLVATSWPKMLALPRLFHLSSRSEEVGELSLPSFPGAFPEAPPRLLLSSCWLELVPWDPYMCKVSGNMPRNKWGSLSKKEGKSGLWWPLYVSAEKTLGHRDPPCFDLMNVEVFIVEAREPSIISRHLPLQLTGVPESCQSLPVPTGLQTFLP